MYFRNRSEAGARLAAELLPHRYENCAAIALSDGAVLVAEQIAASLHCILTMLLIEEVAIPGEEMLFGTIDQNGGFTYNKMFSAGELEYYYGEFHGALESGKMDAFQKINRLLAGEGLIERDMLKEHVVILVSDGMPNGVSLDAAAEFLKPIHLKKLVVVTPIASVQAVDRMHILADELHVLNVTDNFLGANHYYDNNDIPSHGETIQKLQQVILNWR